LTLGSDGRISGSPSITGLYAVTIRVADARGGATTVPATIPIRPRLYASLVPACAGQCSIEAGCVAVCGAFGSVGGGVGPYMYSVQGGAPPAGTTLSQSAFVLNGTFAAAGVVPMTARVSDVFGVSATVSATFNVFPHIAAPAPASCVYTRLPTPRCNAQLKYTGGTPGKQPSVKATGWSPSCAPTAPCAAAPAFLGVTYPSAGVIAIALADPGQAWHGTMALQITDQSLCAQSAYCSNTATLTIP
jgi:hypothetical protein